MKCEFKTFALAAAALLLPAALHAQFDFKIADRTGKASMPKTLGADSEVVAYVAKTKGAIGYVGSSAATAGVKTLEVK